MDFDLFIVSVSRDFIETMELQEFEEWLEIPATLEDLNYCYEYFNALEYSELNEDRLDLIYNKILEQTPHRTTDK